MYNIHFIASRTLVARPLNYSQSFYDIYAFKLAYSVALIFIIQPTEAKRRIYVPENLAIIDWANGLRLWGTKPSESKCWFIHYKDVIMSAMRLKSPASRLFTQAFIQE